MHSFSISICLFFLVLLHFQKYDLDITVFHRDYYFGDCVSATSLLSSSIILRIFTPCRSTSTNYPSPCLIEPLHPAGLLTWLSRQGQMDQRRAHPLERALQHSHIGASARGTPNQHATSPSSFPRTHSSAQFYPPTPTNLPPSPD